MNYTILFSIFSVIAIVGLIFSFSMNSYIQIYDSDWNGIFSNQEIQENSKKRIFLIGSSSVYSVNATHINHQLSSNNLNYEIFNLADMSDSPRKRIQSIENIISNEPQIVILLSCVKHMNSLGDSIHYSMVHPILFQLRRNEPILVYQIIHRLPLHGPNENVLATLEITPNYYFDKPPTNNQKKKDQRLLRFSYFYKPRGDLDYPIRPTALAKQSFFLSRVWFLPCPLTNRMHRMTSK